MGIAILRCLVYLRAAGISQSHSSGHLVKGFACCIISGSSQNFKFSVILHHHQMRMSSGYNQTHKRRLQIRMFNIVCRNMAFNMMYAYQRLLCRPGNGLCLCHAYQKRSYQPRSIGDTDSCYILQSHSRICKSLLYHLINLFNMLS